MAHKSFVRPLLVISLSVAALVLAIGSVGAGALAASPGQGAPPANAAGPLIPQACNTPGVVRQLSPANGSTVPDRANVTLRWETVEGATKYYGQIGDKPDFSGTTYTGEVTGTSYKIPLVLDPGIRVYWRGRARNDCGDGPWSGVWSFCTPPGCPGPTATNTTVRPTATNTSSAPTATKTPTRPTATNTPREPTATNTPVSPTATGTPQATATLTPTGTAEVFRLWLPVLMR
jgi:hypothetical protein